MLITFVFDFLPDGFSGFDSAMVAVQTSTSLQTLRGTSRPLHLTSPMRINSGLCSSIGSTRAPGPKALQALQLEATLLCKTCMGTLSYDMLGNTFTASLNYDY